MATLELVAGDNVHADTNADITSDLDVAATVYMDDIGADSGEVDAGTLVPIVNTGTVEVVVKDKYGHMVGKVPPVSSSWLLAGQDEVWKVFPAAPLPFVPAATITDASEAHALNSTFSDTEAEAALNALGAKINAILAALENAKIVLDA
jgi:hypothetical protein